MVETDNPAGRLWHVLDHFRRNASSPEPLGVHLAALTGGGFDDRAELLHRFATVLGLPAEVRAAVDRLTFNGLELISELPSIEHSLMSLQLDSATDSWAPHLDPVAVHQLRSASSILHQHLPERVADEVQLSDLSFEIAGLMAMVDAQDSLPDELRVFLFNHLHEMWRAVALYRIAGLNALRDAYERTIGGLAINGTVVAQGKEEEGAKVWTQFGKVFAGVGLVLAAANQGTQLVHAWFPELTTGGDTSTEGEPMSPTEVVVVVPGDDGSVVTDAPATEP